MLGIAGAVVASPIFIRPAHALIPLLIRSLILAAKIVHRGAPIAASITLVNTGTAAARGPVALQYKEASGAIVAQASAYVDVPAEYEKTLNHSGFNAKTLGENEYIATSALNEEEEDFEIVN